MHKTIALLSLLSIACVACDKHDEKKGYHPTEHKADPQKAPHDAHKG